MTLDIPPSDRAPLVSDSPTFVPSRTEAYAPSPGARAPGQISTPQALIDALDARGITGISHETAWFLLRAYGGPDPATRGIMTEQIIDAMFADGSLVRGGPNIIPMRLDLSAIDPKLIAAAIFEEAGVDPNAPGAALDANLLRYGTQILTSNGQGHSDAMAVTQIRAFGSGGVITVDQLAQLIESGGMQFSQIEGVSFIGVTHKTDAAGHGVLGREAQYLLSFDANGDGGLDAQELQAALASNAFENQAIDPKMAAMLWHFYGGTDAQGTWLVTADGIDAMLEEGVLWEWANSDGTAGFAINLAGMDTDRFADGLMRYDRDGSGDLQPEELSEALAPYADANGRVDPEMTQRLGILYGGANGIEREGLKQMLAEGVLVPAVGPAGAETAGYRINLDAVPTERVVDRMFLSLGKDPATATMTAEEFERAIDFVTGDQDPINGDVASYIASMRGSADGAGGFTLNRDQVLSVFTSGAITRVPAPGMSILGVRSQVNPEVPPHHHHHWWDSAFSFFKEEAKDVVSTIADIAKMEVADVAALFNGKLSVKEALAKGGAQIVGAIKAAIERGEDRAKELMSDIGAALKSGLQDLSEGAHKLIDELVHAATELGDEVAIKTLTTLAGMSPEQARDALHAMAEKAALIDSASGLTHEDIKGMIPDYDATVAELEAAADEFMEEAPNDPEARQKLLDAGYTFDDKGYLMQGAQTLSVDDKRDVFAKHFRIDAAVELNLGHANGVVFNGLQGRIFLCYTGRDESGNKTFQLRFRVMDEAGLARGPDSLNADAGVISVHDLVLPFSVMPGGTVEMGDIKWNSSLGVIGEVGVSGGLPQDIMHMFDFLGAPEGAAVPPRPRGLPDHVDSEIGAGWGMTVTYDLSKMDNKFSLFGAELAGLGAGATVAGGGLAVLGATQPELEGLIAKWGPLAVNLTAMVGSFGADLIYAAVDKNSDHVSVSHGAFAWIALPRVGSPKAPIGEGSAQIRARIQMNWGSTPQVMF